MNKLRKPPPPPLELAPKVQHGSPSRTMMFAQASTFSSPTTITHRPPVHTVQRTVAVTTPHSQPTVTTQTRQEQYWAARALTAETLLSASTMYQEQLRVMTHAAEAKHSQEVAELNRQHETRHSKMERLAMLLMTWLLVMAAVLMYLLIRGHPPQVSSRWTSPLHFTIPVLSPFTSVTEHEVSTLSTRSVVILVLASSCLAYGCFTYWIRQRK
ncbi:hypothetical protein BXZ70DRAFT_960056 [Cristinia sonorae]|uniref:Uncharacterized protein n=1 Tax=Cristinia sonorae TaxID=1940300 RepID=A0A8K0UFH9_9AGAR|nr:hypothetical protein BXZ70DRAFT_960056 [Cristinia sonorae]